MFERKERSFGTRVKPAAKRRDESVAAIRRPIPLKVVDAEQLAIGLPSRPLRVVPKRDPAPPDAA